MKMVLMFYMWKISDKEDYFANERFIFIETKIKTDRILIKNKLETLIFL